METLHFEYRDGRPLAGAPAPVLVGVVSSGNLEVLIEPATCDSACQVEVSTAAAGFGRIWEAVLADFFARHRLGDVRVSINDFGATPAVVGLRLDQAAEAFREGQP
jgi:malonate decarboxylase delta subunit